MIFTISIGQSVYHCKLVNGNFTAKRPDGQFAFKDYAVGADVTLNRLHDILYEDYQNLMEYPYMCENG